MKFVSYNPIRKKSALVDVMAWYWSPNELTSSMQQTDWIILEKGDFVELKC